MAKQNLKVVETEPVPVARDESTYDVGKGVSVVVDWQKMPVASTERLVVRGIRDFPIGGDASQAVFALLLGNTVGDAERESAFYAARDAGVRNALMDSHANVRADEPDATEKARALVEKRLTSLYAGNLRAPSGPRGTALETILKAEATLDAKAAFKRQGKKPSAELLALSIKRRIEQDVGGLRARAEAKLAMLADALDVDLSDFVE